MRLAFLATSALACMSDSACGESSCCLWNVCTANSDIGCQMGRFQAFEHLKETNFDPTQAEGIQDPDLLAVLYERDSLVLAGVPER